MPCIDALLSGMVIRGWDEGIKTMQVGELAELICPPDFGTTTHAMPVQKL